MAYVDYSYYAAAVKAPVDEAAFPRLLRDAERIMDMHTTGPDNVRKLRVAYPTDEADGEAVRLCACRLVDVMSEVEAEESALLSGQKAGFVSSVSSGSESISYDTANAYTAAQRIAGGGADKAAALRGIVKEYLSGVSDANGVNLLYMGVYPYVL